MNKFFISLIVLSSIVAFSAKKTIVTEPDSKKSIQLMDCLNPAGLTASSITPNGVNLKWNPVAGATYTGFYWPTGTSAYERLSPSTNSINLTNLTSDKTYNCYINYILSGKENSYSGTITFTTHSNHCYANLNGTIKICNNCSANQPFSACATDVLIGTVTLPNGQKINQGAVGIIKPGYCINASSGVVSQITSSHPGVVY